VTTWLVGKDIVHVDQVREGNSKGVVVIV
jgi:hypothetical protein